MKAYKINPGNRRKWPKVVLFLAITGVMLAGGAIFGVRAVYRNNLQARDASATEDIVFVVETGDTVDAIADGLADKQIIRSSWAFKQFVRTKQLSESFKAGTYSLRQSYDVPMLVDYLVEGKVDRQLFTILPGKRLDQIKEAFIQDGFSPSVVERAFNPEVYPDHPALVDKPDDASLEGYLYPDSYQKVTSTTPQSIIRQSLDEMAEALSADVRAGIARHGLSIHEGITLASIIEQEVPAAPVAPKEDRRKVAQVFLKRLSIGMQLGSDVTAFYGAILDGAAPSVRHDSPYNTRIYDGFPPGPISNVTKDGLDAVVSPADTDYLYFVAGDGEYENQTFFSRTVAEHEQAIARYCKTLCN